ncbi:hypothetical protein CC117_05910 [Parafrankia colletiae]|uniref:J domain-containing protein n=1 Tax=Parafrankia colletiae TaxID=573497 RepID=A0A1S1QDZ6_9ACTN|nr:hypothetical protein [Parafrankia colletiae]MCK9900306.1 hypothetical protein [Frankia sp. Cpl3]OHV30484.1 hypothetical protein CC117_05910 [Parafrankia colletiae]
MSPDRGRPGGRARVGGAARPCGGHGPVGTGAGGAEAGGAEAGKAAGEAARAARRRFILANHPDRGGDPAEFAAGLRAFGSAPRAGSPPVSPPVSFYRRRSALHRALARAAAVNWKVPAARLRLSFETAHRRASRRDGHR